jgi:hypothetical protein
VKYDTGGVNHRSQAGHSQPAQLGLDGFHYLVKRTTGITGEDGSPLALQLLSDQTYQQIVRIGCLKRPDTLIRGYFINAGQTAKLTVH